MLIPQSYDEVWSWGADHFSRCSHIFLVIKWDVNQRSNCQETIAQTSFHRCATTWLKAFDKETAAGHSTCDSKDDWVNPHCYLNWQPPYIVVDWTSSFSDSHAVALQLKTSDSCSIFQVHFFKSCNMGISWAWNNFVRMSAGFSLCGTHRMRPLVFDNESWITAISRAVRSSITSSLFISWCIENTFGVPLWPNSRDPKKFGSSEAITTGLPLKPLSSSASDWILGSYRDNRILFHMAICFSKAPSAVDNDMASHKHVDPACSAKSTWLPWNDGHRCLQSLVESAGCYCLNPAVLWLRFSRRIKCRVRYYDMTYLLLWDAVYSKFHWISFYLMNNTINIHGMLNCGIREVSSQNGCSGCCVWPNLLLKPNSSLLSSLSSAILRMHSMVWF